MGLAAIGAGSGAIAASVAFTTVEAEREISFVPAVDDEALLNIEIDPDDVCTGLSDGDGDSIRLEWEDLNANAMTICEDSLRIGVDEEDHPGQSDEPPGQGDEPPGQSGDAGDPRWDLDIEDVDGNSLVIEEIDYGDDAPRLQFRFTTGQEFAIGVGDGIGTHVTLDIIVNTLGITEVGEIDEFVPENEIVIRASRSGET